MYPTVYKCIYLSVCLFLLTDQCICIYLSTYLSINVYLYRSINISLSMYLFPNIYIYLRIYLHFYLPIYQSMCISINISLCLSMYKGHKISFQTFFVWALLLIEYTWNSSSLRSNLLQLHWTCCTVPTTSARPHGSPLVWACQWPSSQPLSSPQLSHNDSLWA